MADDQSPERPPERPRSEPEIILPGDEPFGARDRIWARYDDGARIHRIYLAQPGWPSLLLGFLILGAIVGLGFLLLAGVLLLWLPLAIAAVVVALLFGPVRYRWHRLLRWLTGQR